MDDEQFTELMQSLHRVALAITYDAMPGTDAQGGLVGSLTESVIGVTSALTRIAEEIGSNSVDTAEVTESLDGISGGLTQVSQAIHANFTSANVSDSNLEPANIVDAIDSVARGLFAISTSIDGLKERT